ncbi:HoxN/HupN/NixA family nickel/cobalt transporter [Acetobacter estunensis]|nr:HoxN/HupN/NixA family nickel/cobalt transporter [Acetobacter estunensis]
MYQNPVFRLMGGLVLVNFACWAVALLVSATHPAMLASAFLAWTFGLRHAMDADHIAAIDTVTRKLMAQGRKPYSTGLFFSLGHSSVVILATCALILLPVSDWLERWHLTGNLIGTTVSVSFLLLMGILNAALVRSLIRAPSTSAQIQPLGPVSWLLRPLMKIIGKEWQMFPLGFLFGLGFDTATEIGLLGLTTTQARTDLPPATILLFPLLFTAGMMLVDSLDTVLMVEAWRWSAPSSQRRKHYLLAVASVSAATAFGVAIIEGIPLVSRVMSLPITLTGMMDFLSDHFQILGTGILATFLLMWSYVSLAGWKKPSRRQENS